MAELSTVIALDTATEYCSVAVLREGTVAQRETLAGQTHSQLLLPLLRGLLDANGLALAAVEGVAFGAGPGGFTGLRISCGVAQGLAYGLDVPVAPVGNLEALALAAHDRARGATRIGVAVDARMQEAYWAAYEVGLDEVKELAPPALVALSDLTAVLAQVGVDAVAGNAFGLVAGPDGATALPEARATAAEVARIGVRRLRAGGGVAARDAAPLYVRDRVAQTVAERRAGSRA